MRIFQFSATCMDFLLARSRERQVSRLTRKLHSQRKKRETQSRRSDANPPACLLRTISCGVEYLAGQFFRNLSKIATVISSYPPQRAAVQSICSTSRRRLAKFGEDTSRCRVRKSNFTIAKYVFTPRLHRRRSRRVDERSPLPYQTSGDA